MKIKWKDIFIGKFVMINGRYAIKESKDYLSIPSLGQHGKHFFEQEEELEIEEVENVESQKSNN